MLAGGALLLFGWSSTAWAQQRQLDLGEYEYEPGQSIHEEEWYDPSDWFDDDSEVEWEPDWDWDYDYDYGFDYYDPYDYDYGYGYDYDYLDYYDGYDYGDYFGMRDNLDYGWYYNEFTDDVEYGWHYDDSYVARANFREDRGIRSDRRQQQQNQRVQGEITDLYTDQFRGRRQLFAQVETNDGRTLHVKLGSRNRVRALDLEAGDRITVTGRSRNVQGRSTFVADRIEADGRSVSLAARPLAGQQRRVSGTIDGVFLKNIGPRTHIWAEIKRDNGETITADLGARTAFRNGDLQKGDDITVLGKQGRMQGRAMFVAERVRTDDDQMVAVRRQHRSGEMNRRRNTTRDVRTTSAGNGLQKLSGEIDDLFTQRRNQQTHMFATIKNDRGKTVQVDLGPRGGLNQLDLEQGDRITVFAPPARQSGDGTLRAIRVKAAGETIKIDRSQQSSQKKG